MSTQFIEGTAIPFNAPGTSPQSEGRGTVGIGPPRSLLDKLAERDDVAPSELVYLDAALRAFANQPKKRRVYWQTAAAQTDPTSGNCIIPLYQVPAGMVAGIANVIVDTPSTAGINPAAPFANAASWAFLARASETSTLAASNVTTTGGLRNGMIAFAPTAAAGPILPFQWEFGEHDAPIAFGGDTIYYVLVGGTQASLLNIRIQAGIRVNLVASD